MRSGLIPFNAALVAFVEATRSDLAQKNIRPGLEQLGRLLAEASA